MAVLVVLLAAMLFIGAASATAPTFTIGTVPSLTQGESANIPVDISAAGDEPVTHLNISVNDIVVGSYAYPSAAVPTETTVEVPTTFTTSEAQTISVQFFNAGTPVGAAVTQSVVVLPTTPKVNVNVSVPGPELVSGAFILTDGTTPLAEETVFTLTADGTTITVPAGGALTILDATASGLYQNLTKGYNFTVKTSTPAAGITLTGDDSVIAGDSYTLTIAAAGSYVGESATVDFGDRTSPASITLEETPQEQTHTYTAAGKYTINVTVNGKSFHKDVTVITGPTSVDVNDHNATFVYQTVRVLDGTTPVTKLYFYSSDSTPTLIATMDATDAATGTFNLLEASVNGHYGAWYSEADSSSGKYITIWYPDIALKAELTTGANGATSGDSVDGKTFNKNTEVSFLIEAPNVGPADISTVKIVFTTPASGKTTQFGTYEVAGSIKYADFTSINLKTVQTIALDTGVIAGTDATAGVWTAQAEFTSPKGFADNAKKTNTISFTLQSTTLTITAAKDSVVRSNPFTVTIQGDSKTQYAVYLEGANKGDVNPKLQDAQSGFKYSFTKAVTENNLTVDALEGAVFETDASGKRTIQYNTAADTEDKTYTIKVSGIKEGSSADKVIVDSSDYDKVKVKVEKGGVTITASGDGAYYIGDEIKLTGTNTDSTLVYLFITGQNLDTDGLILKALPTQTPAREATTSNSVSVKTDNTWEYKWDTAGIALDTGAYTIYATSRLTNGKSSSEEKNSAGVVAVKLSDSEYATISVNLKQPFLSAVPSGTIVAKGDKIYIRGTAEGEPATLQLYIFGPNFFEDHSITVEDDGSYEKKLEISSSMSSNQYFVVVQHPMYNGAFDAKLNKDNPNNKFFYINNETTGGSQQGSFVVWGQNKLQGSQAADALTKMIDDANIDDIYTKLTFTVAEPWIKINNPGDQATGSKFTITGTTNLAVDDQILVEVMSSSFSAVDKTATSTTSGVSQTTKVVKGETDNTWSVEVDTTNWKLDEYTIKVNGIEVDVSTTTNFNLVEKLPDTPKPTSTGATTVPTTATATATATPATPGFGAFVALAGLGAVALLVLRRN